MHPQGHFKGVHLSVTIHILQDSVTVYMECEDLNRLYGIFQGLQMDMKVCKKMGGMSYVGSGGSDQPEHCALLSRVIVICLQNQ